MTTAIRTFTFGSHSIPYALERASRRTMTITVKPDGSVHVRAPLDTEEVRIESVLHKRARWILRQQRFFSQFLPRTPERRYVNGETHLYLGRQYRLRVRQTDSEADQETVKLTGGYIYVYTQEPENKQRIKTHLDVWYMSHAQERFRERLAFCLQSVSGWNIVAPTLHIRPMARRWGACSPCGDLTLNVDLIRAPRACIEYVIMHELCHLRHPDHSTQFYALLSNVMPDWKARKLRLETLLS